VSNACFLAFISAESAETACCRHKQAVISAISGGSGTWAFAAPGDNTVAKPIPIAIPSAQRIIAQPAR
jgi:hypothetical protein